MRLGAMTAPSQKTARLMILKRLVNVIAIAMSSTMTIVKYY